MIPTDLFLTIKVKSSNEKTFQCDAVLSNAKDDYVYPFEIENTCFSNFEISEFYDEFDTDTVRAIENKFSMMFRQKKFGFDNADYEFEIKETEVPRIKRNFFSIKTMMKVAMSLQSLNKKQFSQDRTYNIATLTIAKSRAGGDVDYVARLLAKSIYVSDYMLEKEGEGFEQVCYIGHKEYMDLPRAKVSLSNGVIVCQMEVDSRSPIWAINPQKALREMERMTKQLGD